MARSSRGRPSLCFMKGVIDSPLPQVAMKKILFPLITLVLIIAVFLIGFEMILRQVWVPPRGLYDYSHPFIRRHIRAGVDLPYHGDAVTGFGGEFHIQGGPIGYRTDSVLSREKKPGVYRIFFLGGSTTACTYLPQEKTFPQLIEDHLNPDGASATYECANAGVDGCAARDSLAQLIYNVSWAQPDCVIVMQGVNDFALGLTPDYEEDASDRRTARSKAKSSYEEFEGDPHPYIYQFYKHLTRKHSKRFTLAHIHDEREKLAHLERKEIFEFPNIVSFEKYMKMIAGVAKSLGLRLIFVTQCSLYAEVLPPEIEERLGIPFPEEDQLNPSNSSMKRGMDAYNNAIRQISTEMGVELIDLETQVPKTLDFLYDHVHFTVEGNRKVAEVISEYLKNHPASADPEVN